LGKATVWYEATRRVSIGFSGGYLFTRPAATWLEGNRFTRQRVNADTWLAGVGLAYWLF
jgi:hypothetical protein